jgi:hypothetical protein
VRIVPSAVVDALPLRLWQPANLHLGARLHFCTDGARTIEWIGRVIGRGRRDFPFDEVAKRWPENFDEHP